METDEHLDGSWENGTVVGSGWGGKDPWVRPLEAMHRMLQVSDSTVDLTTVAVLLFPLCTFFFEAPARMGTASPVALSLSICSG